MPVVSRRRASYCRGLCKDLVTWFFSQYMLLDTATGKEIDGYRDFYYPLLASLAVGMISYKKDIYPGFSGSPGCDLKAFQDQIASCLDFLTGDPEFKNAFSTRPENPKLHYTGEEYGVMKRPSHYSMPLECEFFLWIFSIFF